MAKKFVAFLDILGFKDLVENNSAEDLIAIYTNCLNSIYDASLGFWEKDDTGGNTEYNKLKSVIISDSMIIWADNVNQQSFLKLVMTIETVLMSAIINGIPLRGAIEYNEFSTVEPKAVTKYAVDNTLIILGKALTHAYQNEQIQNWAGCIISDNAIEEFEKIVSIAIKSLPPEKQLEPEKYIADINTLIKQGSVVKYLTPMKTGNIKEYYCIDWTWRKMKDNFLNETTIRESFKKHNKVIANWNVETIIKNTIDFYKYCKALEERKKA